MRWVSLEAARSAAADALKRFPMALLCAWSAAGISDWLVLVGGTHPSGMAAVLAATLGIPLFFSLALLFERLEARSSAPSATLRWLLQLAGLAALVLLAVLLPRWSEEIQIRRYVLISLFTHALAAVLPYLAVREPNGFWHYNRTLLMRLIVASVFSSVLLGGLEGALASFKPLLGIAVSPKAFFILSSSVYFMFHPWFFLGGIPRDLATLEQRHDYPSGIKIFAQFILVPLVVVYQALLTAYLIKVIFTGQWPSGLIGWLVSAEAVAGILAILLVHPVRDIQENRWVRTFARGFYIALIPSIVMLALSIGKRVGQYGVTEDRYFVMVLTGWLAAISAYFLARRDGDIRWIPVTLGALALLSLGGPWGAFSVSRTSQAARLARVLEANGLLVKGKVQHATHAVPLKSAKQLSSLLDYLINTHGTTSVRAVMGEFADFADSTSTAPHARRGVQGAQQILGRLGVSYVASWESETRKSFSYYLSPYQGVRAAERVDGCEYHVRVDHSPPIVFSAENQRYELRLDSKGRRLVLFQAKDTLAVFPLEHVLEVAQRNGVPADTSDRGLRVDALPGGVPAFLVFSQIGGNDDTELSLYGVTAEFYFSLKRR